MKDEYMERQKQMLNHAWCAGFLAGFAVGFATFMAIVWTVL